MRLRLEAEEIEAVLKQWARRKFGLTGDPDVKVMIVDNYGLEDIKEDQHIDAHIELPPEQVLRVTGAAGGQG